MNLIIKMLLKHLINSETLLTNFFFLTKCQNFRLVSRIADDRDYNFRKVERMKGQKKSGSSDKCAVKREAKLHERP